jgi:gliding motility-associated-like protein
MKQLLTHGTKDWATLLSMASSIRAGNAPRMNRDLRGGISVAAILMVFAALLPGELTAQCCTLNMSFERAAGSCFGQDCNCICNPDPVGPGETWSSCPAWGCGSTDIGPNPGSDLNMGNTQPTEGNSYLSMTCSGGPDGMGEGISMTLCTGVALTAGTQYCFSIDLITRANFGNNAGTSRLRIYGSASTCQTTQLLWDSPTLTGQWQTYNFCFTPTGNWTVISFRVVNAAGGFTSVGLDRWVSTDGLFPPNNPTEPITDFSYSTPLCTTGANAAPAPATGFTIGGAYTASPVGLSINATTGVINPSASTPGNYTVTYAVPDGPCANASSSVFDVEIIGPPTASITYNDPFCAQATSGLVTLTGTVGGAFTSTTGLSINAATGEINPSASTPGTYTVTYTAPAMPPCGPAVATTQVEISDQPAASIAYLGSPFCSTQAIIPVTVNGTGGGTFSATPAGLSIIPATGAVNGPASTAGVYTVTYTIPAQPPCAGVSATASLTINSGPVATIDYPGSPYCTASSTAPVTLTGASGGVFSSTVGLVIDPATGALNPSLSTPGTYVVTYTLGAPAPCPALVVTAQVIIVAEPNASINYGSGAFCVSTVTVNVNFQGTPGGVYSSATGLALNPATGQVSPSGSTPGTYTITYTSPAIAPCVPAVATADITIIGAPTATIAYAGPLCTSGAIAPVILQGDQGGAFSAPAGLSINTTTGAIDPSSSQAGTYTVTYTIAAPPPCANLQVTASITINEQPSASIAYSGGPYCATETSIAVTLSGTSGGTFSSSGGLSINPSTGAISGNASTAGTYTVNYAVNAPPPCVSVNVSATITLIAAPVAGINYPAGPFCTTDAPVPALITADGGGLFNSAPGLALDPVSGMVDPATSAPGAYTVTYTIPAPAPCANATATDQFVIQAPTSPVVDFTYPSPLCNRGGTSAIRANGFTNGGTFTAASGLAIDALTGAINLDASAPGVYQVRYLLLPQGCVLGDERTFTIVVTDCQGSIYVPNAFTPNNDGFNDRFGVVALGVETMRLDVFNRWGELIFSTESVDGGWDGTYKGELVQDGVYPYRVTATFLPGYKPEWWTGESYGHITVLR